MTRHDDSMRPFSIMDLAPQVQRHPPAYQSPTPPLDDDDNEAMDWTPSQDSKVLRPATSYRDFDATPQPTSYRASVSTNAPSQSHILRNSHTQPLLRTDFVTPNRESLKTPKKYALRDSLDESPFATPYAPSHLSGSPDLSPIKFAQPRFFPQTDREDLGLESLMANNFSLAEEPHEVRARRPQGQRENETQLNIEDIHAQWHGPATLFLLVISCAFWISTPISPFAAYRLHFRLAGLCIAALVILKFLLLAVRTNSVLDASDIMLLAFELITVIILGATLCHRAAASSLDGSIGSLETLGIILIAALIAQEAWMLYFGAWTRQGSNVDVPSPPTPQPTGASDEKDRQRPLARNSVSPFRQDTKAGMKTDSLGLHLPASSQHPTRSTMQPGNDPRARGGFSSLSLGGITRDEQVGLNSLNLGQPRRRDRTGLS